jgi:hypothetical protein
VKEQEDSESSSVGVGLSIVERSQVTTDAPDQAARRGSHFVVAEALRLNLEIGTSGGVIEFRREGLD